MYVELVHFEREGCCYFLRVTAKNIDPGIRVYDPGIRVQKGLSGNGFTKTVTPYLRSIVPNVQRHMSYFASAGHWLHCRSSRTAVYVPLVHAANAFGPS